jgi:tetratricopeptide (TPR) repeat protein
MGGGGERDVDDGRPGGTPVAETLDDMLAGDDSGLCAGLLDLLALLPDVGAGRWLLHTAGKLSLVAAPGGYGFQAPFAPEVVDSALAELAEAGLVTIDESVFGDDADDDEDLEDADDAGDEDAGHPEDLDAEDLDAEDQDEDDLEDEDLADSAFDTVTVDPDAGKIIVARQVADGTVAELGARACALLDEAARSGADIDYALLADGMTACWDQLLPHLGAADDELVKDLLSMRGWGLYALTFYPDVSEAGMIEFGERLVADYELALGPGHPDAWQTRRNMAQVYQHCGRHDEAIEIFARLRLDVERALPADDGEVLATRGHLASGFLNAGRHHEAVREYTELLADHERVLGRAHSLTLSVRGNLGEACLGAGREAEGLELIESAADGLAALLGPDYWEVVRFRERIAEARGQVPG